MKNKAKAVREKLEISQGAMAEACGVSRQTIYAIENGAFKPSVVLALKISRVLNTTVEALFILEKED